MAFLDDDTHFALACLEAVTDGGGKVGGHHLDSYKPFGRLTVWDAQRAMVSVVAGGSLAMSNYLARVGWAALDQGGFRLTSAGRAVLRASERSRSGGQPDAVFEMVLSPDDPLVYARLVQQVAGLRDVMIVDPYFRMDGLHPLVDHADIRRVLVSDKLSSAARAGLEVAVEGIGLEGALEVRIAEYERLHDRYFIASDKVISMGSSINGVGAKLTVVAEVHDLEGAVRTHYEQVWAEADILARWEGAEVEAHSEGPGDGSA